MRARILRTLEAAALLNALMAPELVRLTVPPALLVILAIVPDPLRLIVPVLVKFPSGIVMGPGPVLVIVPVLTRVEIETVPPTLSVLAAPLLNVPVPERVVPTVRIPLLVYVPVMATLAIEVFVDPLSVLPVPENVCVEVFEVVKIVALFVRLF